VRKTVSNAKGVFLDIQKLSHKVIKLSGTDFKRLMTGSNHENMHISLKKVHFRLKSGLAMTII
jgi:hypothetical protein